MTDLSRRNIIGPLPPAVSWWQRRARRMRLPRAGSRSLARRRVRSRGKELPSFRFPLGKQPVKTYDGGWAKEATVAEFPVSEKLAGVLMQLSPGALRELHWHANAAEWAYVIRGRCRVTTIDPQAHSEMRRLRAPATSGISRAATAIRSRAWAPTTASSSWYSTTATSRSSAPSASPTGSRIRRPRCWPRTSACRPRPSRPFRNARSTWPRDRCRRRCRADPAPGSLNAGPLTHRYRLLAQRPETYRRRHACGWSRSANSRSRRP